MRPQSLRPVRRFTRVYLYPQMQVVYALDELRLFWLREKAEDPQFEPHARIKMAQVLGSIMYIYLWVALGQVSA